LPSVPEIGIAHLRCCRRLTVVRIFQELLLQFQQFGINISGGSGGIIADERCNIILQDFHVATFIQNHFVDGFQDDALQNSLIVLTPQAMLVFCWQLLQ